MSLQKIQIIIIITIFLLLGSGCSKDNLQAEFYLTDEIKSQNPYVTGDTIIFANSNDDTIVTVVDRENHYIEALISSNSNRYNLFEEEKTSIKGDSLIIQMRMYYEPHKEPLIDFYIFYNGKSGSFYNYSIPFTPSMPRVMSIKIHDKWYYNIYYFERIDIPKLYYSTEHGVLRIEFSDGDYLDYLDIS